MDNVSNQKKESTIYLANSTVQICNQKSVAVKIRRKFLKTQTHTHTHTHTHRQMIQTEAISSQLELHRNLHC